MSGGFHVPTPNLRQAWRCVKRRLSDECQGRSGESLGGSSFSVVGRFFSYFFRFSDTWKWWFGRLFSFTIGWFLGSMLPPKLPSFLLAKKACPLTKKVSTQISCWKSSRSSFFETRKKQQLQPALKKNIHPPKTNMTMEIPPFENVFPIEKVDFPMSC